MYHRLPRPATAWLNTVANAAPNTPILKTMIQSRSSPMFRKLATSRKYRGRLLSPRARIRALVMLYSRVKGMPIKMVRM